MGSTSGGGDVLDPYYTLVLKPNTESCTMKLHSENDTHKETQPSAKVGDKHPVGCCGLLKKNLRNRLGVVMVSSALCQRLARSA